MDTNELGGEGLPKVDDLNDEHYCDLESGVPSDSVGLGGDHSDREEQQKESEVQHLRDSIASAPSYLEVPGKTSPAGSHNTSAAKGNVSLKAPSRRTSTRVLSLNFQQSVRDLKRQEHQTRVKILLVKNADFYEKRRLCECVTMLTLLIGFTGFSLYVVFAHGFHFGNENPFSIVNLPSNRTEQFVREENETVELLCQTDSYWEWCRWIHLDTFCDFEWMSPGSGVQKINCDIPATKIEFTGDYDKFQCGVRLKHLDVRDRGNWQCEVEKYYVGFSRRYGEFVSSKVNLIIIEKPRPSTKEPPTTRKSTTSSLTTTTTNNSQIVVSTQKTKNEAELIEEYRQQFFLLKIFVLGTIGLVLTGLVGLFWAYFLYLWKTLDNSLKRDHVVMGPDGPEATTFHTNDSLQQRKNSASFSTLDEAERKSALLGRDSPASSRRKRRSGGGRGGARGSQRKVKPKSFADAARLVQMAKRIGTKTIQNLQQQQLGSSLTSSQNQQATSSYQLEQIQCSSLDKAK